MSLFDSSSWSSPQAIAAYIISAVSIITVALGFIFKDFLIPNIINKRNKKRESKILLKRYTEQIITVSISILRRLDEIYKHRAHYLATNRPTSDFYKYKYKSSVYRLCALLGGIRAYRLDESIILLSKKNKENISKAINDLAGALADGQQIEMFGAQKICSIFNIDINELEDGVLEKLSIELDHLCQDFPLKHNVNSISELEDWQQKEFIKEITLKLNELKINTNDIPNNHDEIITVFLIKTGLLFRDWQQAIGDIIIDTKSKKDTGVYKVIGFAVFERIWDSQKHPHKVWYNRVEIMFKDLDISAMNDVDSRVEQLKRVYGSIYALIATLHKIMGKQSPLTKKEFEKINFQLT